MAPTMDQRERLKSTLERLMVDSRSIRDLANKIGVNHSTVHGWIKLESYPDSLNLQKIASLSGISVNWLLHGSKPIERSLVFEQVDQWDDPVTLIDLQDRVNRRMRELIGKHAV